MNPFPVSAKRLADCTVQLRDASLEHCVLVPLFNAQGTTVKVVLLSARTRECWALDWRPELAYVPLVRNIRVDTPRGTPQRVAGGEPLWLFDPQGLVELAIASLSGGATVWNAATVLPSSVIGLTWRRDLSRISGVSMKKKGGGTELGRWKADWLADASPQPATMASSQPVTEAQPQPTGSAESDRRTPDRAASVLPQPSARTSVRSIRRWVLDPIWVR